MNTEQIDQYIELHNKTNALLISVKEEFEKNLKAVFENNPTLVRISMRINNHEFNDGDSTSFSLYYEDLTIIDTDGNEIQRNDYSAEDEDRNNNHPLVKAAFSLFDKYDVNGFFEYLYGDEFDELEISRGSVLKNNEK